MVVNIHRAQYDSAGSFPSNIWHGTCSWPLHTRSLTGCVCLCVVASQQLPLPFTAPKI